MSNYLSLFLLQDLFKDGCFDKVKDLLLGHLTIVAGVAGGILGVLVSPCLLAAWILHTSFRFQKFFF